MSVHESFSGDVEQPGVQPEITRRRFFQLGLAAAASGTAAIVADRLVLPQIFDEDKEDLAGSDREATLSRITIQANNMRGELYNPGDTIDFFIPITIGEGGWSLAFDTSGVRKTMKAVPDLDTSIYTNNTLSDNRTVFGGLNRSRFTDPRMDEEAFDKLGDQVMWRVRPLMDNELEESPRLRNVHMAIQTSEDDPFEGIFTYFAYHLQWFDGNGSRTDTVRRGIDLIASEELLSDRAQSESEQIIKKFHPYTKRKPSVFVTSFKNSEAAKAAAKEPGNYDPVSGISTVASSYIENEALRATILTHELAHVVHLDYQEDIRLSSENQRLNDAFDAVIDAYPETEESYTRSTCDPGFAAPFKAIDETTTFGLNCKIGHPGDNMAEMFASVSSSVLLRPEILVSQIAGLKQADQQLTAELVASVIAYHDKVADINAIEHLIPADSPARALAG